MISPLLCPSAEGEPELRVDACFPVPIDVFSVVVAMMNIRYVKVAMQHWLVPVPMRMRFAGRIRWGVHVLMVLIVAMTMFVFQRFMEMVMLVMLG